MEAYLRCSALGLNSEVVALPQPCKCGGLTLFGTGKELPSGSMWTVALSCVSFPAGNSCYLKCAKSPEEWFKNTEGIFVSLLLKGVHFLENLRLADLHEPITGCLNLWKAPISEQTFPLYLQRFSRLVSLCCCPYGLARALPLPMLGKRTLSAPGKWFNHN